MTQYGVFSKERAEKYEYHIVKEIGKTDLVACLVNGVRIVRKENSHIAELTAEADAELENASVAFDPVWSLLGKEDDDGTKLICWRLETPICGAAVILKKGALDEAFSKVGSFYILPSSIHELLIYPCDGTLNVNDILPMVREINATEVKPQDKLSDNVYMYDGKEVTIAK